MKYQSKNCKYLIFLFLISCLQISYGQFDFKNQINSKNYTPELLDSIDGVTLYEPLNMVLRGDSTRIEKGYAVSGWISDYYNDGQLLHKGYYLDGQLKVYKNYFPNGNIERSFINIDNATYKMIIFYSSGIKKRSRIFHNKFIVEQTDYNNKGIVLNKETYSKDNYILISNTKYFDDGSIKEELKIKNPDKMSYTSTKYYKSGIIEFSGKLNYNSVKEDYIKVGKWNYYKEDGKLEKSKKY